MRPERVTDLKPRELAEEARRAYDDPDERAALAADRARLADAVAAVLDSERRRRLLLDLGEPRPLVADEDCSHWWHKEHLCLLFAAETAERGHPDFAAEWLAEAHGYHELGAACEGK
ncbi:MAG: hypothetical protein ACTHN3_13465 [Solirubrobacterales bacterium]